MKKYFLLFACFFVVAPFFASPALAEQCQNPVKSDRVLEAVKAALEQVLNRSENAFQRGLKLVSYTQPLMCSYDDMGDIKQMKVSTKVKVESWSEEGDEGAEKDVCDAYLIHEDGEWTVNQLICEGLDVDEEA